MNALASKRAECTLLSTDARNRPREMGCCCLGAYLSAFFPTTGVDVSGAEYKNEDAAVLGRACKDARVIS